jgi:uncharacterized protein YcgI (DUF1989 family)
VNIHIEPQTGAAFIVTKGDVVRVIDPAGEQVSDVVAFSLRDPREALSSGRTLDYNETVRLSTGHVLYSNRGNPMLTIGHDDVGTHDFMLAPCSPEMFALLHGITAPHPSCFENLASNLAEFGIERDAIPTAFNVFMNVEIAPSGAIRVLPPLSKAGDYVELRAEMDLIVGATACSAEQSNNGAFKPIDIVVASGTRRD